MGVGRAVFLKLSSKGFSGALAVGARVYYHEADLNGTIVEAAVSAPLFRSSHQSYSRTMIDLDP